MTYYAPQQATLDRVAELLSHATPQGAYHLGVVTALAWTVRTEPPAGLLEAAVECDRLADALKLFYTRKPAQEGRL